MLNNRIVPKPWWQVSLTILPGLLLIVASIFQNAQIVHYFSTITVVSMLLVAFWVAIQQRALSKLPVWAIIPLGYLLFLFSGFFVDFIFSGHSVAFFMLGLIFFLGVLLASLLFIFKPHGVARLPAPTWGLFLLGIGLILLQSFLFDGFRINPPFLVYMSLPIAAGLFLTREHGLVAGLIVIPTGVTLMTFDIEHVIYFWDAESWSMAISLSVPLLFYVLTPLWMLRSRSILVQAAGLLVPIVIYYVVLVFALVQASVISPATGHDLGQTFSIAQPAVLYFITMAFVTGLYGWVSQQDRPSGDQTPPSALNSI